MNLGFSASIAFPVFPTNIQNKQATSTLVKSTRVKSLSTVVSFGIARILVLEEAVAQVDGEFLRGALNTNTQKCRSHWSSSV
jgi:hypothetical protein